MLEKAAIVGTRVIGIGVPPLSLLRFPRWISLALTLFLATFVRIAPVHAQGHGGGGVHGGPPHGGGGSWHDRGGGRHGGGGSAFFDFDLSAPYYPYNYAPYPYYYPPDYYAPPAYYAPAPAPMAALPPSWYYCDNPQGYYPYVASCAGGWRQVPAQLQR